MIIHQRSIYAIAITLLLISTWWLTPRSIHAQHAPLLVITDNDSGEGSLRWAIEQANLTAGHDVIHFNIPPQGVHTIHLLSKLPGLTDEAGLIIDGITQAGAVCEAPVIVLNGAQAGIAINGIEAMGGSNVIRGLVIQNFGGVGIWLYSAPNFVECNYIGTDATGMIAQPNATGILVDGIGNVIGKVCNTTELDTPGRNVISGNLGNGIHVNKGHVAMICANYIGLNAAGTAALGNGQNGIFVTANEAIIGASNSPNFNDPLNVLKLGNAIGGNAENGIKAVAPAHVVRIKGNFIGMNRTRQKPLGNASAGILIDGVTPQVIDNIIVANGGDGFSLHNLDFNTLPPGYEIHGNVVGSNSAEYIQSASFGNHGSGIVMQNVSKLRLYGNRVYNSDQYGLKLVDSNDNQFDNLQIGPEYNYLYGGFNYALGNKQGGIWSQRSARNIFNILKVNLNSGDGITFSESGGAELRSASIVGNIGLGIRSYTDEVNISLSLTASGATTIHAVVVGLANTTYIVQPFNNIVCEATGDGEGLTELPNYAVMTDATGKAELTFDGNFRIDTLVANHVTAFVFDPGRLTTSPFSNCVTVTFSTATPFLYTQIPITYSPSPEIIYTYSPVGTSTPTAIMPTFGAPPTYTLVPSLTSTLTPTPSITPSTTPTGTHPATQTPTPSMTPSTTPSATMTWTPEHSPTPSATTNAATMQTIGVYLPSTNTFYLRSTNTTGSPDLIVSLAALGMQATDVPLAGDWNGDGIDTLGFYRASTGQFVLSDSNVAPQIDYSFTFGNADDVPVVGDWDGDGRDGIGVYRPSNGFTYLKNQPGAGVVDYETLLGTTGDVSLVGDWNGDGSDSLGVYRPLDGIFYLSNQVCTCSIAADYTAAFGPLGMQPFSGDWDGDGRDGFGVYNPADGKIFLHNDPTTSDYSDVEFVYNVTNGILLAGRWSE